LRIVHRAAPARLTWAEDMLRDLDRLREWAALDEALPNRRAIAAAYLWSARRTATVFSQRPIASMVERGLRRFPDDGLAVGHLVYGRASVLLPGGKPEANANSMQFCVYQDSRAVGRARGELGTWWPGKILSTDLAKGETATRPRVTSAFCSQLGNAAVAGMGAFTFSRGSAQVDVRRSCGLLAGGLCFSFGNLKQSGKAVEARPWSCVRGRDKRAWLEFDFGRRVSFDTIRVHFALDGRSWEGLARRTDIYTSHDRVEWTLVKQAANTHTTAEKPPQIRSVLYRLPQVTSRYLRLSFRDGGIGGVIRIMEVEVRNAKGAGEPPLLDLASATRNCRVSGESAASAEQSPARVIDGVVRPRPGTPAPACVALGWTLREMPMVLGVEGEGRREYRHPLTRANVTVHNVRWLWDGQAGFLFSEPAAIHLRKLRGGRTGFCLQLHQRALGVTVMPRTDPETLEDALDMPPVRWYRLEDDMVWAVDSQKGAGMIAAFAETSSSGFQTDGPCLVCYRIEGRTARVSAKGVAGTRAVGLELQGMVRLEVNGKSVEKSLDDPLFRFEAPMR